MKDTKKKVTKALAKEIAAKFFGRSIKLDESVSGDSEYSFASGIVRLNVFKNYYRINQYPYAQVFIFGEFVKALKYVDGELEFDE